MTMKKASLTALFESNPFEMTSNDDSDDGDHPTGGLIVPILPPPASSPVEDPVDPTEATELAEEPSLKETSCSGDANDATESGTGIAAAEAADPPAPDPENSEPPKKDATSETDCHDDYETTTKRISWAKPSDGTNEHDTDASRDASVPGRESSVDHNYRDFSAIGMMEAKIFTTSTASDDKAKVDTSFPALLHRILSEPAYNNIISWRPHGRAWGVLDENLLISKVLSGFAPQLAVPGAFTRHIHEWGFKRLHQQGSDNGAYYHECFLFDKPHLTLFMDHVRGRVELMPNIKCEPNFYEIAMRYPLNGNPGVGVTYQGTNHLAPVTHQSVVHNGIYPVSNAAGLYTVYAPQPGTVPLQTGHTAVPHHLGYIIQQQPVAYGHHSNASVTWPQLYSHQLGVAAAHSAHPYVTPTTHAGTLLTPSEVIHEAQLALQAAALTAPPSSAAQEMQLRVKPPKMRFKQTGQQPKRRKRVHESKNVKTAVSSDLLDKAGQSKSLPSAATDTSLGPDNYAEV